MRAGAAAVGGLVLLAATPAAAQERVEDRAACLDLVGRFERVILERDGEGRPAGLRIGERITESERLQMQGFVNDAREAANQSDPAACQRSLDDARAVALRSGFGSVAGAALGSTGVGDRPSLPGVEVPTNLGVDVPDIDLSPGVPPRGSLVDPALTGPAEPIVGPPPVAPGTNVGVAPGDVVAPGAAAPQTGTAATPAPVPTTPGLTGGGGVTGGG